MAVIKYNIKIIGFGVATGRTIDSVMELFNKNDLFIPDIIISSVGTEMHYTGGEFLDKGWRTHIAKKWNQDKIKKTIDQLDFLSPQGKETQREFKISYFMKPKKDRLAQIHDLLIKNKYHYNMIYSHSRFLDILPLRASKGKAIKYISYKWGIPLNNILVCGDSGNDEEMLRGNTLGVVVGNHTEEVEGLRGKKNIYFSNKNFAAGIIDGLKKYKLIERSKN